MWYTKDEECRNSARLGKWRRGDMSFTKDDESLERYPSCVYRQLVPFYFWVVFHGLDRPQLNYSLIEGHLSCLQFSVITSKQLCTGFCMTISLHCFGINIQDCNCWSHGGSVFIFLRNCQTVSRVLVLFQWNIFCPYFS